MRGDMVAVAPAILDLYQAVRLVGLPDRCIEAILWVRCPAISASEYEGTSKAECGNG
jgi:hypothetical protein